MDCCNRHIARALALAVLLPVFAGAAEATAQPGAVRLQVTTRPTGAKYSPRHVLAVWVTDAEGRFVRTLMLKANRQRSRLSAWLKSSAGNTAGLTDAVSGATLRQHEPITVDWDCRNAAGVAVPDGWYQILVEFTERNGAGPVTPAAALRVRTGPEPYTAQPQNLEYFRDLRVSYQPGPAAAAPVPRPAPAAPPATPAVPPAK